VGHCSVIIVTIIITFVIIVTVKSILFPIEYMHSGAMAALGAA